MLTRIVAVVNNRSYRRGHYVGVHSTSFKDMMLKPEIMRAIVDNAFEHPSEGT